MSKASFEIEGMSCDHCVKAVRNALAALPGVSVDNVSIGAATVEFDPNSNNIGSLVDAIADAGYEAREVSPTG
jgi:copper chaperone CopZ